MTSEEFADGMDAVFDVIACIGRAPVENLFHTVLVDPESDAAVVSQWCEAHEVAVLDLQDLILTVNDLGNVADQARMP